MRVRGDGPEVLHVEVSPEVSPVPTIAIIDDDEAVRRATESLIRSLGFGTRSFASAEDFLKSAERDQADCVITDIHMAGMSGVDLQSRLRAEGDTVPLIFITGYPEEKVRRQLDAAGAFGFLAKPFEGNAMIDCIDRALEARAARRPV